MPNTVIYANILPFIGVFFLMFFVIINPLFDKRQNKMFFLSAMTILFMLVAISVDYAFSISDYKYAWIIRRITSFFNFAVSCAVPIYLILIFTNKRMNPLLYLPALINLIICAISIFTNLVFFLPKDGGYERGPLFFLPSAVTIFYIAYLLIASIRKRNTRAYESLFLIGVIIGLICALYLEIVNRFKFLTWDFAAVFLILYYLLLNINKSKIDSLTGANNRSMYIQKTESINRSRQCLIAMIDINGFKTINDEKGHAEGDNLLIQFVETAKSFMDKKTILYRIGGDEFAVISEETSLEKFRELLESFFAKLQEHNIFCAVGFEEYDPAVDIENSIHAADMKMYEDKRRYYSNKTKPF